LENLLLLFDFVASIIHFFSLFVKWILQFFGKDVRLQIKRSFFGDAEKNFCLALARNGADML